MEIIRTSILDGKPYVMDVNVTKEELQRIKNGEHIQHVVPHLSKDIREFLISGITPEEWTKTFGVE